MSDGIRTGACLCGAVRISVKPSGKSVAACHCKMCRTWGGGPLFATNCGTEVRVEGEVHLGVFRSSEWAERAVCMRCGTHLFYRLMETGDHEVCVGLLEDADWSFDQQIFIDEKPAFYAFANVTADLTGAEVFAQYSETSD